MHSHDSTEGRSTIAAEKKATPPQIGSSLQYEIHEAIDRERHEVHRVRREEREGEGEWKEKGRGSEGERKGGG